MPLSPAEWSARAPAAIPVTYASRGTSVCGETGPSSTRAGRGGGRRGFQRPRQEVLAARAGGARAPLCLPPSPATRRSGAAQAPRRGAAIVPLPPSRGRRPAPLRPFPHSSPGPSSHRRQPAASAGSEQRENGRPKAAAAPPQRSPPRRRARRSTHGRRCPAVPGDGTAGARRRIGPCCPSAHTCRAPGAATSPSPAPAAPYRAGGGGDRLRARVLAAAGGRGPGRERALRGSARRRRGHGAGRGRARDRNEPRGAARAGEGARLT